MTRTIGRISFPTVLATAMGAGTFSLVVFAVLASNLIEEFGAQRWQIGALVTATTLIGAVISPAVGGVTDRIGARNATLITLFVSAAGLAGIALSPVFAVLVVAALIGGVGQAIANPATNKLISLHAPVGRRGVITGIKQSGVQFGTFLGGLTLPALAVALGWRWAVAAFAAVFALGAALALTVLPEDPDRGTEVVSESGELPPIIWKLAIYGFMLGAAGTAIFTYLPLFAEESLGFSKSAAGFTVAFTGFVGIAGRIGWGRIAEHRLGSLPALRIIAVLSAVAAALLIASTVVTPLVWVAAVVTGLSASSWNAVGMLAVITTLPTSSAGRGSGVVLLGFLFGLAVGAPAFGYSVDRLGSYIPGWIGIGVVFLAALLATRVERPVAEASAGR